MALAPINPFKNRPHGTQVTDALAPGGAAAAAVFVGYPDGLTIVADATTVIEGTNDFSIVDGAKVVNTSPAAVWVELGTVGTNRVLRLGRIRYGFLRGSDDWVGHPREYNPVTSTPVVSGIDGDL